MLKLLVNPAFLTCVFCVLTVSCSRTILPSYALEVPLNGVGTPADVFTEVTDVVTRAGYKPMGKGGYDELYGTDTTVGFENSQKISVSLSMDRETYVPIRISYYGDSQKDQARLLFKRLVARLSLRWPHTREVP